MMFCGRDRGLKVEIIRCISGWRRAKETKDADGCHFAESFLQSDILTSQPDPVQPCYQDLGEYVEGDVTQVQVT